jgi:hypothetical protein
MNPVKITKATSRTIINILKSLRKLHLLLFIKLLSKAKRLLFVPEDAIP